MVSDTLMQEVVGHGLVFDRIYRIEGGEGTRKARKSRGERRREEETPIVGKATLTLHQCSAEPS